jgi:hypothetical protein
LIFVTVKYGALFEVRTELKYYVDEFRIQRVKGSKGQRDQSNIGLERDVLRRMPPLLVNLLGHVTSYLSQFKSFLAYVPRKGK